MFGLLGTKSEVVPRPLRPFEVPLQPPPTPTPPSREMQASVGQDQGQAMEAADQEHGELTEKQR